LAKAKHLVCVKVDEEVVQKIDRYIRQGRYKSRSDFVRKAIEQLLVYEAIRDLEFEKKLAKVI
jgi:Arc/MetJ-type ribon-helix-helix transcriptional regulator